MGDLGEGRERAVLWLPADGGEDAERVLLEWCARRGYEVIGMVRDDAQPGRWDAARTMLMDGRAEVLVASRWQDLPGRRTPRVEAVDCWDRPPTPPAGEVRPLRRRRPRVLGILPWLPFT